MPRPASQSTKARRAALPSGPRRTGATEGIRPAQRVNRARSRGAGPFITFGAGEPLSSSRRGVLEKGNGLR